jgi:hypothetical protein
VAAAGALLAPGGALAAAALDFFLLFFPVDSPVDLRLDAAGAVVSAAAVFEALPSAAAAFAAAFLLFRDLFVVVAVVSPGAALSAAAAFFSAAAFSFLAFFLDFWVVVSELVSVELACAVAVAGEIATVSIRQKASIQRVN